ncbi:MAG TPA: alpha/beta hydrolase [Aquabacterium sp.]|uniref:alpha/beta fold hydrolase n=1 Tax=Aquabacterium sp. TaxID=1872578 RepID=UPI002E347401|nr:alpha/beta hydrolase [Aquabacterium sp.]HEX5356196.1 alpha/beta hydrolase [Aquabacterium sp.]
MQLIPWSHTPREGFAFRGWHSPASGKPLLHFIHGNGFCTRAYEPMLRRLTDHFDLWLFDAQGHGESEHGGAFLGWNRNADIAMEALEKQGGEFKTVPHYAAGHSFGGVLTSLILGDRRHQFQRAVLLDPVLMSPTMLMGLSVGELTGIAKQTPMARQARARRKHWPSREEAFAQLHGRGIYKGWADEALQAFVTHALKDSPDGGVELKCRRSREADIFSTGPDRLWGLLGRVRTPTLVLHARHTYPFVKESVARWRAINDAVSDQEVPGGHCFMQEDPAFAAEQVQAFLLGSAP